MTTKAKWSAAVRASMWLQEEHWRQHPAILEREIRKEKARAAWGDPLGIRCLTSRWGEERNRLSIWHILPRRERLRAEWDMDHPLRIGRDHTELWVPKVRDPEQTWRVAAITFHPYGPRDRRGIEKTLAEWDAQLAPIAERCGLVVRALPPSESWYVPGSSYFIQIIRPEIWDRRATRP